MLKMMLLAGALTLAAQAAVADPIPLHMARGTDTITVHGVLRQKPPGDDCCTYSFEAAAGQKLYWTEKGAVARLVIAYPNGDSDGPGFDNPLTLPATGTYQISVSPDLMADGAFGPFSLTLKIPPKR